MRTRLAYQLPTETIDADGTTIKAWVDQFELWARVRQVEGSETVVNQQVIAQVKHQVTVRYRPDFNPAGRFVVRPDGRILNIEAVLDDETRRAELAVACVERVGATA